MALTVRGKISKSTYKLFGLYIVVFYAVPFLAHLLYPGEFSSLYQNTDILWPLTFILLICMGVFLFDIILPRLKFPSLIIAPFTTIIKHDRLNFVLAIVFLVSAVYFFQNFSINFRHKQSISEAGGIMMSLFFCRIYFKAFIFYKLSKFYLGQQINGKERITLFIVFLSFIFSLNSSWDAVFIFVLFILLIQKGDEVFSTKAISNISQLFKKYINYIILILVFTAVIFIGYANKVGSEKTLELFGQIELLFLKVVKRLSVWYISVLTAGVNYFENTSYAIEPFLGTIQSVWYRIGRLLDFDIPKPEIWSINRMNYLHLFIENKNPRTGSSPGLFASLFYVPFLPISFFVITCYTVYVLRKFSDVFLRRKKNISSIGLFILLFFMIPLFESPVNLMNVLDKGFIYFIFFTASVKALSTK